MKQNEKIGVYYLDTPLGLIQVELDYNELLDIEDIYDSWNTECVSIEEDRTVFELSMKQGGK